MAARAQPIKMGNHKVEGLADGVDATDAVNKGQLDAEVVALQDQIDAISIPAFTQTDFISGIIAVPTNTDYRIVVQLPYALTISSTTTRSTSGTCTATFKINTTALGGSANSVSTTEEEQAHASSNAAAAGDDLVITVSANATCQNLSFTIKFTRTLA